MYRPPSGNNDIFFNLLENLFLNLNVVDKEVCLIGDFNINYLRRSDGHTKKAIEFARMYGLKQLISSATHLGGFSTSCIDLMFTNVNCVNSSGVLNDVVNGHFPSYAYVKNPREK